MSGLQQAAAYSAMRHGEIVDEPSGGGMAAA
jgi:hypothetical protein